jgi:PAS domain S-box-containing protein
MSQVTTLIVEDEGLVSLELRDRLETLGYNVVATVRSGEEALERAAALQPDLVLMDIRLAGEMDGVTAARKIRDDIGIPVVFVTAMGDAATVERASAVEPFGYVLKPFDGPILRIAISTALYRGRLEKDRRKAIAALQVSRAVEKATRKRLELVLRESPATFFAGPASDERALTYLSPRLVELLGVKPENAVGHSGFWSSRLHPDDAKDARSAWVKCMETGSLFHEYRLRHEDGTFRWVRDEASLVKGPDDTDTDAEIVGFWTDVTGRRRAEVAMHRSERLAAVGSLVTGLAHEVRNPLFAISAAVDAMESDGVGEGFEGYADVLRSEVKRLADLMVELMEYGRPSQVRPEVGSLREAIEEARLSCLSLARNRGVVVDLHSTGTCRSLMERGRMMLVFRNLIENAIQHAPSGSAVSIAVTSGQGFVECHVTDEGPGFRSEDLPHVFEPFFTRRRGGTGLGLSIAQRIVEEHGGELRARNGPERGALMILTLPEPPEGQ